MRRREFLLLSGAGLLAARMAAKTSFQSSTAPVTSDADETGIFPRPVSVSKREGRFAVTDDVVIVTSADSDTHELSSATALRNELADWFGLTLTIKSATVAPPYKRAIVIGTANRAPVHAALAKT